MCIAIYKPSGRSLSTETLQNAYIANPDGCGFMFASEGIVRISKSMCFTSFLESYERIDPDTKDVVVHFRVASSGEVDLVNCHPHRVHSDLALAHNGILDIDVPKASKLSDTVLFRDRILARFETESVMTDPVVSDMLEAATQGSKIAFLDGKGRIKILHEQHGFWKNGCWFSNLSYVYMTYAMSRYNLAPDADGGWADEIIWLREYRGALIDDFGQQWDRISDDQNSLTCEGCGVFIRGEGYLCLEDAAVYFPEHVEIDCFGDLDYY